MLPISKIAVLTCAVVLASSTALVGDAQAQTAVQRTFVSTSGDDANTVTSCSATAPCRSFLAALGVTLAGGEIIPLTSGGYGPVTITKSVGIIAPPGVYAGITHSSGIGITIAAATTDRVVLKGLTINGLATGGVGIDVQVFGTLHIENCEVVGGYTGIRADITNAASIFVNDTIVRDTGDAGFYFRTTTPPLKVSIDNTRSEGNKSDGFTISNGANASISRTIASNNTPSGHGGFVVYTDAGKTAELNCDTCFASNNGLAGFFGNLNGSTIRVTHSTVTDNSVGFYNINGTIETLGTNMVRGNTTPTLGIITTISPQ